MRLADVLVDCLIKDYGVSKVFTVTGGGAMYLNDAFGSKINKDFNYIAMHHEQSAAMASEAFSAISNDLAVCQITTGPGGTNAITGCVGAWIDSRPILFISGQVESFSLSGAGIRQTGVQEANIVELVKSITKMAIKLEDPNQILYELDRLIFFSKNGRRGPVWFDIPLDLQNFNIENVGGLPRYSPPLENKRVPDLAKVKAKKFIDLLRNARRPLLCIGNGARDASKLLLNWAEINHIPIALGWNAKDFYPSDHALVMGSIGQFGNRSANILTSKSDLIIGVGYRFSVPQIGYDPSIFAPQAYIVSIDIDEYELNKYSNFIDFGIKADAKKFITEIISMDIEGSLLPKNRYKKWGHAASNLKDLNFDQEIRSLGEINSFDFTSQLGSLMPSPGCIVTDMGTSFTCTHQHIKLKAGIRIMTSSGLASMGFGLPGAIGAHFAQACNGLVTLITGDGGLMFNLQELQSLRTHNIPLKIIIYENGGYLTMRLMQQSRFGRLVGSGKDSNLECADFVKIAKAFDIPVMSISNYDEISKGVNWLYTKESSPSILLVHLNHNQELTPRVQTQSTEDGKLLPGALQNMFPFFTDTEITRIEEIFIDA
jgi:acetolactate synthase-1/2/3 large subunit